MILKIQKGRRWRTAGAVPHPKGNYETAGVIKAPPAGLYRDGVRLEMGSGLHT